MGTDRQIIIESTVLKIVSDILDVVEEELLEYQQNLDLTFEERKLKVERISAMRDIAKMIHNNDYIGKSMS